MSLSDDEKAILAAAGESPLQTTRGQAVAIVLSKRDEDAETARSLLAESYLRTTQPSFHLIPRGQAMAGEADFVEAYERLASVTSSFTQVTNETLSAALDDVPAALAPLRMILGFTHNEFAVAMNLVDPTQRATGARLKQFERRLRPATASESRKQFIAAIAETVLAVMSRAILSVPAASEQVFHSKLDKRDTSAGWESVANDAQGVPYSALLYQRYVGGVWRQVQDAYSEVKGDSLLERPLAAVLERERIPFHRTRSGASGAVETAQVFGITPGPDFLLPSTSPTVVIESKVGEDGGTVRDKAARILRLAGAAGERGLVTCAVVDGKGWRERPTALVDVVLATRGLTFTLSTLEQVLGVPEISALRRTAQPDEGVGPVAS